MEAEAADAEGPEDLLAAERTLRYRPRITLLSMARTALSISSLQSVSAKANLTKIGICTIMFLLNKAVLSFLHFESVVFHPDGGDLDPVLVKESS